MREPPKIKVFQEAGQRMELRDLGSHVELMFGNVPILTSKSLGTESAFGKLVAELCTKKDPRVLVGGLGFGATLAGVLSCVGERAEVIVVEKLTTVVTLLRGELSYLANGVLDDPRVKLVNEDVARVLLRERQLDVILLDVDNGPDWGSFKTNQFLYSKEGLVRAHTSLAQGGAFCVWSGYAADGFLKQLKRADFHARSIPLLDHGKVRARAYVGQKLTPPKKEALRGLPRKPARIATQTQTRAQTQARTQTRTKKK